MAAATRLLTEGGTDGVSTRAVSAAAGVQPPTIYRLFGDKQGLLEEVAAHGFTTHLLRKTQLRSSRDPVENLRASWDLNVEFGLSNPALYTLMYGHPRPGAPSPAAVASFEVLAAHVRRIAEVGRLRVPESRAAAMLHAAGSGVTLSLIATAPERRDLTLSHTTREAVITAISTEEPVSSVPGPAGAAITLRAALPGIESLSASERSLLREWLDRISDE